MTSKQAELEMEAAMYAEGTPYTRDELITAWKAYGREDERVQDFFERFTPRSMNKNDFVFCCITGLPMASHEAGAENDGWKGRPSLAEAVGYHDALESGDLGPGPQAELAGCSGSFNADTVAAMLDEAKRELVDPQEQ